MTSSLQGRRENGEGTKQILLRLDPPVYEALKAYATNNSTTVSAVAQQWIVAGLSQNPNLVTSNYVWTPTSSTNPAFNLTYNLAQAAPAPVYDAFTSVATQYSDTINKLAGD